MILPEIQEQDEDHCSSFYAKSQAKPSFEASQSMKLSSVEETLSQSTLGLNVKIHKFPET